MVVLDAPELIVIEPVGPVVSSCCVFCSVKVWVVHVLVAPFESTALAWMVYSPRSACGGKV